MPRVAMVAYRFKPDENPAPSAKPIVCSGFTASMLPRLAHVTFYVYARNVPFDSIRSRIDSIDWRGRAMFGLRQLFYPWGFVVQAVALVHFARRRPEGYWLYVILFGGFVGARMSIVV